MTKSLVRCSLFAILAMTSLAASAHGPGGHGHGHGGWRGNIGFYFGGPVGPSPYWGYPYSYYPYPYGYVAPPVVITQPQPQVYIEQGSPAPSVQSQPSQGSSQSQGYWYHCDQPEGYYPYVKECPAGWKAVSPTPPPAASSAQPAQ